MAKTAKLRKKRVASLRRLTGAECSEQEIQTTLSTLAKLSKSSSLLESPQFALIREQLKTLSSKVVNPVTHVTQLLTELSFENALGFIGIKLESRVFPYFIYIQIKLGTIQRWVSLIGECEDDLVRHQLLAAVIAKADPSQISPDLGLPLISEENGLKRFQNYVIPSLTLVDSKTESESFVTPEFKRISNEGDLQEAHIPIHVIAGESSSILYPAVESTIQKFELPFAQDSFVLPLLSYF
jgi:hypothetical protein